MTPTRLAAALNEAIPDGTFGRSEPAPRWTTQEQDRHWAELCEAIGAPNSRAPRRPAA